MSTQALIVSLQLNLDVDFLEACLSGPKKASKYSPPLFTETFVGSTIENVSKPIEETGMNRLTNHYPNAFTDFYGSKTPCIYKTGPEWHKRTGNEAQGIYRAARPIYDHAIRSSWLSIGWKIVKKLDSLDVDWNAINPLAYADAGEATAFCPFVITIAVEPYSLLYDDAVVAGNDVVAILSEAGFPDIQVAFIESTLHRSAGHKLRPLNPLVDPIAELRKYFTGALGLSIAPLDYPNFEGTGGFYFRLNETKDDDRVALLTCAHVVRPPAHFPSITATRKNTSQPREEIVALGNGAFQNAVNAIMKEIGNQVIYIEVWNKQLNKLGAEQAGEDSNVTVKRNRLKGLIEDAKLIISEANQLHDEVGKHRTTAQQRVIGAVLHCEEIRVAVGEHQFTKDWSFLEVYRDMIDWDNFNGNKIFIGGNKTPADFVNAMFSQVADRMKFHVPEDSLLKVDGVVPQEEFYNPQDFDMHNQQTLLCVKNGRSTDTTFGRVNGLESFTRHYKEHNIKNVSIEIAVLGYDMSNLHYTKFSDPGDSGAGVVGRDGRIIGLITGGGGPTSETDITYITPFWWLLEQIKAKFPKCFLYPAVD
ncbi:hypothetical protein RSOLAG22IIIB_11715 [Rhizoctonia solani]|uniref:Peptidase S1 domain-containing protein n=1 Tax=Rhizoctonia solani TaxID=456999 RepID=A0A0K6GAH4_9AGAM|nr:hypothetical protein RSOLAG22IIIB_11715 [Rhizoctonia solani]